jgi:hypothetical protein
MAFTLTPINVKDASGTNKPMIVYNDGTNNSFANAQLDATGAIISPATSGLQTTANSTLATIAAQTNGLATAAAQTTGNTSLASVATNTGNVDTNLGAKADSAAASDTGTFSLMSLFKRALQSLTTGNSSLASIATNTTGAATAANQATANASLSAISGNTGAGAVTLTSTPTTAGTTHAAGDVVGAKISLSGAARSNSSSGLIQNVMVDVTDNVTATYDVLFFDADPSGSTFTDDAAVSVVAADLPKCCAVVHCDDVVDVGTRKVAQATNVGLPFKIVASDTTLFAVIVARSSAAYTTANGVTLRVNAVQF